MNIDVFCDRATETLIEIFNFEHLLGLTFLGTQANSKNVRLCSTLCVREK